MHLLRWYLALGSPVVLACIVGSALPEPERPYLCLSVFCPSEEMRQKSFEADPSRRLTIRLHVMPPALSDMRMALKRYLANGGIGLTLINTVRRAQELVLLLLMASLRSAKASVSASACRRDVIISRRRYEQNVRRQKLAPFRLQTVALTQHPAERIFGPQQAGAIPSPSNSGGGSMGDDKSNNAWGMFNNPLPILMVGLLAAGVLVKNVPLESARPADPERVKLVPAGQQDVEARLWQDPFAAVEKHENSSDQTVMPPENIPRMLSPPLRHKASPATHTLETLRNSIKARKEVIVVAVSVFGGSYAEDAEGRRRSRFAVVSALGSHDYHPEDLNAIGYFYLDLPEPDPVHLIHLTVPYEWFKKQDESSYVLVLWLNEDKLSTARRPLNNLHTLVNELTLDLAGGLKVKLIGPAGSAMLVEFVRENSNSKQKLLPLKSGNTLDVFSPNATISNCDLTMSLSEASKEKTGKCFIMENPTHLENLTTRGIIRTTGTDDVLSTALLWELWQRGVNRDSWWEPPWLVKGHGGTSFPRKCQDGLVLIGERDTEYGRTLSRYLSEGFSEHCKENPPVRTFTYLRGLDGVLPDMDNSGSKTLHTVDSGKSKDLRAQLEEASPEHAEGRSQFDYLRRLGVEIDRLDHDHQNFAANGVKAIGIVGSDLYDKLLILQALRSRFKDQIFFTTDLDARYLHADQKDWARNLVVASHFGLSLRPLLQLGTPPFRDGYQTATYLATRMALENRPSNDWPGKMKEWLHPQIFEIGRTEAVHLASPSVTDLTQWVNSNYSEGSAHLAKDAPCDGSWTKCENVDPIWPELASSHELTWAILGLFILGILLLIQASRYVHETLCAAFDTPSRERDEARVILYFVASAVVAVVVILKVVSRLMEASLAQGTGEPSVWLEGVSVWPSLAISFIGFVTLLALALACRMWIRRWAKHICEHFELPLPPTWTLGRGWSAAWIGPHLDLASFGRKESDQQPAGAAGEVGTLWQNYLRATSLREMMKWIVISMLLVGVVEFIVLSLFGWESFPHRGQLVETLHDILGLLNWALLWLVIFWVGYEARACAQFIETLSGAGRLWPPTLLDREEAATGVPRAHLDDYLAFRLIVLATQRISWLIYLPFVSILFAVLSRSNLFDTINFPLGLVCLTGLAVAYALHSAVLLRTSAESARVGALERYEARQLTQARAEDGQPTAAAIAAATAFAQTPIRAEQIKILMERIRNTREGAFAPFAQQPALQAVLLPFGGYGGVQLIEYLINLKV